MAEEKAIPAIVSFNEKRMRPVVARALPMIGKLLNMQREINFVLPRVDKPIAEFFVMAFPYAGPIGVNSKGVVTEEGDFFCLVENSAHAAFEREELTLGQVLHDALSFVCVEHKLVDDKISVLLRNRAVQLMARAYFVGSTTFDMAVTVTQALMCMNAPSPDEAAAIASSELQRIMNKKEA